MMLDGINPHYHLLPLTHKMVRLEEVPDEEFLAQQAREQARAAGSSRTVAFDDDEDNWEEDDEDSDAEVCCSNPLNFPRLSADHVYSPCSLMSLTPPKSRNEDWF